MAAIPPTLLAIHVPTDPSDPRLPEGWPTPPPLPEEEPPADPEKAPKHDPRTPEHEPQIEPEIPGKEPPPFEEPDAPPRIDARTVPLDFRLLAFA